jgi:hypothetical protein
LKIRFSRLATYRYPAIVFLCNCVPLTFCVILIGAAHATPITNEMSFVRPVITLLYFTLIRIASWLPSRIQDGEANTHFGL